MRQAAWASSWPNLAAEETEDGAAPHELIDTMKEMIDLMRLTIIKRAAKARRLRATNTYLTNRHPTLPREEEVHGYNSYGGYFGQNSHFGPTYPTYNQGWMHYEDQTYGGYHYPAHHDQQLGQGSEQDDEKAWMETKKLHLENEVAIQKLIAKYQLDQDREPSLFKLADSISTLAKAREKARQEDEKFWMEIKKINMENLDAIHKLNAHAQVYEQAIAQNDVVTSRSEELLAKEVKMPDADESLPKDTEVAEESAEEIEEDNPQVEIQDECDQVAQGSWAVCMPMSKALLETVVKNVLKAPEAEEEIPLSTLPLQTSTMSMKDGNLPVIVSSKHVVEEEGKTHVHLGQDVEDNGYFTNDNDMNVKVVRKRVYEQLIQVKILRLKKAHDHAIRLKKFEHGRKMLLYDSDDQD